MTDLPLEPGMPTPAKQDPETLVLRGRPRRVIRFRKAVVVGGVVAFVSAVAGLTFLALEPPTLRSLASADGPPGEAAPGDALAKAPGSYSDVPGLGPPLPGDLGRPILERQRQLAAEGAGAGVAGETAAVPESRRSPALEAEEAARSSALLVSRPAGGTSSRAEAARLPEDGPSPQAAPETDHAPAGTGGPLRSAAAAGNLMVAAGSVIPASLLTGLSSDVPGTVIAQVTENVRDSLTGRRILIPQGARLIGSYDSRTVRGQSRALLLWDRLLLPDGSSVELGRMAATDGAGFSGVRDRVDGHGWELAKGVVLASLLGVGSELSVEGGGIVGALREALQQNGSKAGEQIVGSTLDIRPTLTVRPGWPVRVLVTRDLLLAPWSDQWAR